MATTINCKHGFCVVDCNVCERERRDAAAFARGFEACRAAALGVAHDASTLGETRDDIRALSPTADTGGGEAAAKARQEQVDTWFHAGYLRALADVEQAFVACDWLSRENLRSQLARLRGAK